MTRCWSLRFVVKPSFTINRPLRAGAGAVVTTDQVLFWFTANQPPVCCGLVPERFTEWPSTGQKVNLCHQGPQLRTSALLHSTFPGRLLQTAGRESDPNPCLTLMLLALVGAAASASPRCFVNRRLSGKAWPRPVQSASVRVRASVMCIAEEAPVLRVYLTSHTRWLPALRQILLPKACWDWLREAPPLPAAAIDVLESLPSWDRSQNGQPAENGSSNISVQVHTDGFIYRKHL